MIRITPTQAVTGAGMLAFLFIQVMVLEIRSASTERAKIAERVSALEAKDAAIMQQVSTLDRKTDRLGDFVVRYMYPLPTRKHSESTPPPPEL